MSRLHELAQRLGVEITHSDKIVMAQNTKNAVAMNVHCRRPDKDIAHDILAKLPITTGWPAWNLDRDYGSTFWWWTWRATNEDESFCGKGAFEEAVCALAERHLENKP